LSTLTISLLFLLGVLLLLLIEAVDLRRHVACIPIRILVNGTRGKSTVTRYVAAGLRSSGLPVLAKITGVVPTVIQPDGSQEIIRRRGRARVQEQICITRKGGRTRVNSLVLECMSISPDLLRLEGRLLQPQIYVITNIRDDHREQMGTTDEERVEAICSAIPEGAIVVTADEKHASVIRRFADLKRATVVAVNPHEELEGIELFHAEFPENVAVAIAVCRAVGFDSLRIREAILEESRRQSDYLVRFDREGRNIAFVNGFSVNDVDSARVFLEQWTQAIGEDRDRMIILNTRRDRPLRTAEFAAWCATIAGLKGIVLTGTHVPYARRVLSRQNVDRSKIYCWSRAQIARAREELCSLATSDMSVFGFGNIAGDGMSLSEALRNQGQDAKGAA